MGSRAQDNQVTTISYRKADVEGHSMTAVADALFCIFLHARFVRRDESITDFRLQNFQSYSKTVVKMEGIVLTYGRGYSSEEMTTSIIQTGVACVCKMRENTTMTNTFVWQRGCKAR